jgi:hypothetical protein
MTENKRGDETAKIRQRRPVGPVIGQGTWYIDRGDRKVGRPARGIDLGMTHIDLPKCMAMPNWWSPRRSPDEDLSGSKVRTEQRMRRGSAA